VEINVAQKFHIRHKQDTSVTELQSASVHLYAAMWRLLVSVITILYNVALVFIVKCGNTRFLCDMRVFEVRTSSSSPGLPLCQICFFRGLHCWARPCRKITYSITHSPSLFDGNWSACTNWSACASEKREIKKL